MKPSTVIPLGLAALALAALPFAARAQAAGPAGVAPATAVSGSTVPGWGEFVESLRSLPDRMLARLPEAMRTDPQVQQEVARLALESLASQTISAIGQDGDAPQFLPSLGQVLNVGQPNADTVYRSAAITPGGTYRIRGRLGSLNHTVLAQMVPPGTPGGASRPHLKLGDLHADKDGRFDLLLSASRPGGYAGDWWELHPAATTLMLRMVSGDWAGEVSPTLAIERLDKPVSRPRVAAEELEKRLRKLPQSIDFLALMFVDHHEKLRRDGYVNRFKVFDVGFGALEGQFYYEGAYDLADDEALIVESPVPTKCDYRSLILTNEIYETTDWYNNHASLNLAQAAPDSDGRLRIVVAHRDPGVKNWLDTAGHPRGVVQGRWTHCDSQPMPEARVVKLKDLRKALPKDVAMVTPEQRQAILRERRRALLERPLW